MKTPRASKLSRLETFTYLFYYTAGIYRTDVAVQSYYLTILESYTDECRSAIVIQQTCLLTYFTLYELLDYSLPLSALFYF